jgi:hypothetical protein
MDADGSNLQLLTPFVPGVRTYRTAPDWSPDGRSVAYEQQNGDFQVWLINIRDKEPRRLTSEGENEGPSWAPRWASPFALVDAWWLKADMGSGYRVGPIPAADTQSGGQAFLVVSNAELSMSKPAVFVQLPTSQ